MVPIKDNCQVFPLKCEKIQTRRCHQWLCPFIWLVSKICTIVKMLAVGMSKTQPNIVFCTDSVVLSQIYTVHWGVLLFGRLENNNSYSSRSASFLHTLYNQLVY